MSNNEATFEDPFTEKMLLFKIFGEKRTFLSLVGHMSRKGTIIYPNPELRHFATFFPGR